MTRLTSITRLGSFCSRLATAAAVVALAAGVCGAARAAEGAAVAPKPAAPAVPEAYLLQPGDEVAISVLPRNEFDCSGTLAPDGVLYLKGIGEIRAAGLTIPQLTGQVQKALERKLRKPRVTVSLTKLAPPPPANKITVVGSVLQPGPRDLEDGLRVAKAIEMAGGAGKDADLSRVVVIHRDLTRAATDLSTPERLSDPKQNLVLREGDSVYVPVLPPKTQVTVTVGGAVAKGGPIEGDEAPRVYKALELAGGALKEADLSRIVILHKDLTRTIVDLSSAERVSDPAHNRQLEDGDSVEVPSLYKTGTVSIDGAVVNAGSFELRPGMVLEDLIVSAGKLTTLADVKHIQVQRTGDPARTIDLEAQQSSGAPRLALQPGDRVRVPEFKNRVMLVGAVPNPGLRPLEPGQTIYDFLIHTPENAAALDTTRVDLAHAQVIRSGEPALPVNVRQLLKDPRDKRNVMLKSGDVVFLPGKEQREPGGIMRGLPFLGTLASLFAAF